MIWRHEQNVHHFADDILSAIFKFWMLIKKVKFVPICSGSGLHVIHWSKPCNDMRFEKKNIVSIVFAGGLKYAERELLQEQRLMSVQLQCIFAHHLMQQLI